MSENDMNLATSGASSEQSLPPQYRAPTKPDPDKLSSRNMVAYSLGGFGRDMAYALFNGYLLTFIILTKTLTNAQFAAISIIIVCARIFDGLNDPIMGGIVEATRTKIGKFKPWILAGAVSTSIVILATFTDNSLTGWGYIGFIAVIYFLFSITFTMNDISYWGMLPSLAKNAQDRNKLTSFANIVAQIGGGAIYTLAPILTAGALTLGGNAIKAYMYLAIITCVFFIGCQLLTVIGVKEKPLPPRDPNAARFSFKKLFKVIFSNKQLLWLSLAFVIYNVGNASLGGFSMFYLYFSFGYEGIFTTIFGVLFGIFSAANVIFYPLLAKKLSRNQIMAIATIVLSAGYIFMFCAGTLLPADPWILKMGMLMIGYGFVGFGQSLFYLILFMCVANTVEFNQWKSGNREEGLIFSLRPLMAKIGSGLVQLVIMVSYLAIGIMEFTNQISDFENQAAREQITTEAKLEGIKGVIASVPESKKIAILACMCFIPLVLIVIAYIIYKAKFKIDEHTYDTMLKEIKDRQDAVENGEEVVYPDDFTAATEWAQKVEKLNAKAAAGGLSERKAEKLQKKIENAVDKAAFFKEKTEGKTLVTELKVDLK